ncbi:hypothetical protein ACWCXX_38390, partial [Streptomyces sp. NPDC001732]
PRKTTNTTEVCVFFRAGVWGGGWGCAEQKRRASTDHPSVQLADLVAGATAAVAARHAGVDSSAADDLCSSVIPLINDESLLPYDSASALAAPGAAPH